jgi:hypothetical protein
MITPSASAVTSLSFSNGIELIAIVIAGMLLAGLVVILGRSNLVGGAAEQGAAQAPGSVVRSWIAISLVMGLLVFCGAAFLVDDMTLRSTLLGGLVSSVGGAVAFYFSSKTADQARADIVNALTPAGGTPAGGTPAGGTPAGGTPAGGTPAGGAPAGGAPAGGAPAGELPAGELPAGEPPAGEPPAGGAPVAE